MSFSTAQADHLDPDRYAPAEMPIVEGTIAGHNTTCPCCGKVAEWFVETEKPCMMNDIYFDEIEAGWVCADCNWWQDAQPDDESRRIEFDATFKPRIDC